MSVWLVTGFVAQSPDQKVFNKKTQATDIYQICSTAVGSCFITGAHSKYICPQGVLEGALPLSAVNEGIRSALGKLFSWKLVVLISVVVLSVLFYRPFCKWICPLGAFYALFNKVSLLEMKVDEHKCVSCGKCAKVCKMDVDVTKTPNSTECIRCGKCISACPTEAVSFQYGFGLFRKTVDENVKIENKTNKNETKEEL